MKKLRKGFTFSELIVVMSIIMMTIYIWRDMFAQKSLEMYLKDEADKIKFMVYEYVLNPNVGYVSGASSDCGNLSFDRISAYRIGQCVGVISDRFLKITDTTGCNNTSTPADNNIGLCSHFTSDRVIPFKVFVDENPLNTDTLYLYVTVDTAAGLDIKKMALLEQSLYGYLANAFSPILLAEYSLANWNESSPKTNNIDSNTTGGTDSDGKFMLELKKI